jgi:hypothetical protein
MTVDLRTCKFGDKLKSQHGMILTYVKPLLNGNYYDHEVNYPNGSKGTRTNTGHVYHNADRRLESDHDIVEIIPA